MSGGLVDQSDPRNGNRTIHRTMSISIKLKARVHGRRLALKALPLASKHVESHTVRVNTVTSPTYTKKKFMKMPVDDPCGSTLPHMCGSY